MFGYISINKAEMKFKDYESIILITVDYAKVLKE